MKPQAVRLADVFVIGPAMYIGGRQLARRGPVRFRPLGNFLALAGIATVLYNGRNYLRTREIERRLELDI